MTSNLLQCPDCGHMVSRGAFACPGCGKQFKKTPVNSLASCIMTLIGLAILGPIVFFAVTMGIGAFVPNRPDAREQQQKADAEQKREAEYEADTEKRIHEIQALRTGKPLPPERK